MRCAGHLGLSGDEVNKCRELKSMVTISETAKPWPHLLLCSDGTANSYDILRNASRNLSDGDLKALEEDIGFYEATGLVGIHMSAHLLCLSPDAWAQPGGDDQGQVGMTSADVLDFPINDAIASTGEFAGSAEVIPFPVHSGTEA